MSRQLWTLTCPVITGSRASYASEAIYDAVLKVVRKVQIFLTEYREEAHNTLNSVSSCRHTVMHAGQHSILIFHYKPFQRHFIKLAVQLFDREIPAYNLSAKICPRPSPISFPSKLIEGYVNIGIIFSCIGNSQWCLYKTQSKSDRLFIIHSRVLQADWLILENNEKTCLNIKML